MLRGDVCSCWRLHGIACEVVCRLSVLCRRPSRVLMPRPCAALSVESTSASRQRGTQINGAWRPRFARISIRPHGHLYRELLSKNCPFRPHPSLTLCWASVRCAPVSLRSSRRPLHVWQAAAIRHPHSVRLCIATLIAAMPSWAAPETPQPAPQTGHHINQLS